MPVLRFWIAIALRALMGLAGLALAAYGWIHVFGAAFILFKLQDLLEATDNAPPLDFLLQLFAINAGLGILGIVLLVLAIRGLVARVRAGLPTEEEGIGQSPAGRLLSAVLYGAGFCFAVFSLGVSIVPGMQVAMLVATGTTVEATVTALEPTEDPKQWIIHYSYDAGGQTITGSIPGSFRDEFERARRKTLEIAYETANPARHEVTENYGHADFAWFVLSRVLVLCAGLWGLMRNLAPMPPKVERAGRMPASTGRFTTEPPQAAPMRVVQVEAGARKSFGRRGT